MNRMDRGRPEQPGEHLTDIGGTRRDRATVLVETSQKLTDELYCRVIHKHRTIGRKPCSANYCLAYR
jgi:hypothetical protein